MTLTARIFQDLSVGKGFKNLLKRQETINPALSDKDLGLTKRIL